MTKICAITGYNGFVGTAVGLALADRGWTIRGLVRNPNTLIAKGLSAYPFELGMPLAPGLLDGVDTLIHCAHDFSSPRWVDNRSCNILGSEALFDVAHRTGVKRLIFISSMAAFEGCKSIYGRAKLAVEEAVTARGGISVRPGFIFSENSGGLAATVERAARALPILPMLGSGDYPLYACHINDLCAALVKLVEDDMILTPVLTAASDRPISLRGVALRARRDAKPPIIVPTPWLMAYLGLRLLEAFGLRPGLRSDSVVSLVNANKAPDFSPAKVLGLQFRAFD